MATQRQLSPMPGLRSLSLEQKEPGNISEMSNPKCREVEMMTYINGSGDGGVGRFENIPPTER